MFELLAHAGNWPVWPFQTSETLINLIFQTIDIRLEGIWFLENNGVHRPILLLFPV